LNSNSCNEDDDSSVFSSKENSETNVLCDDSNSSVFSDVDDEQRDYKDDLNICENVEELSMQEFSRTPAPPSSSRKTYMDAKSTTVWNKGRHRSIATRLTCVPCITEDDSHFYFMMKWSNRMMLKKIKLSSGLSKKELDYYGAHYEILYSELITRTGKGRYGYAVEDKLGPKYYKA